jgi:organic radical activating enzyme
MSYTVNEIFHSLQGEGVRAGKSHVFIRFAGCNQTCKIETHGFDCDTDFSNGVKMTAKEIVTAVDELAFNPSVILTGGEPCLQVDDELIDALARPLGTDELCRDICLETNGSVKVGWTGWLTHVTVSPKSAEHTIRIFDNLTVTIPYDYEMGPFVELRYVRNAGQAIPKPSNLANDYCISPAFNADGTLDMDCLQHCIGLVKENPEWRLSVQQHKFWRVR